jgi:hypothetical protein
MRPVIVVALSALLIACARDIDTPCCPRGIDGKCAVLTPAAPGATNRRLIQFGSPECEQQVCVTELEAVDGGPPQGYCSLPCASGACPVSSRGQMRCDSTIPASDGGSVSVCLRPSASDPGR